MPRLVTESSVAKPSTPVVTVFAISAYSPVAAASSVAGDPIRASKSSSEEPTAVSIAKYRPVAAASSVAGEPIICRIAVSSTPNTSSCPVNPVPATTLPSSSIELAVPIAVLIVATSVCRSPIFAFTASTAVLNVANPSVLSPTAANNPVASVSSVAGAPILSVKNVCISPISNPAISKDRNMPEPSSPTAPSTSDMSASPSAIAAYNPVAGSLPSAGVPICANTSSVIVLFRFVSSLSILLSRPATL